MGDQGLQQHNHAGNVSERLPFWPSAARWLANIVNSWAHFVPLLLVSPFSRGAALAIYRNWARLAHRIFGITYSLRDDNVGDLGPRPHLYVWLNQSSLAEALACALLVPPSYWIINVEYAAIPPIGWMRVLLRDIVIIRQWKQQAKRAIERAAARLARGEVWMISIEGARSLDGGLQPYKKGPVVMALRSQATIIPMAIHGGRQVMPPGEWRIRAGHIEVHLLKAVPTRGLTYQDRDAVLEKLHQLAERELLQEGALQGAPAGAPALLRSAEVPSGPSGPRPG